MIVKGVWAYLVGFLIIDGGYAVMVLVCTTIIDKLAKWAEKRINERNKID